mmetsp:Transcript_24653/g.58524  ORF Transcript_24653/g.58524 Transcript_24653/m.58524 type:complete len:362 (+) Transcript_24653:316-1401(+)
MPLPTTTTMGRSMPATKGDGRRNFRKYHKHTIGSSSMLRHDAEQPTKPQGHRKPNHEFVLYPTMKRSIARSSSTGTQLQSSREPSSSPKMYYDSYATRHGLVRGYHFDEKDYPARTSSPGIRSGGPDNDGDDEVVRGKDHTTGSVPNLNAFATNSHWTKDVSTPDGDGAGLRSSMSSSSSAITRHSNIIGAQAMHFVPSPPNPRRLATIESAHERLPKSTRPHHKNLSISSPSTSKIPSQLPTIQPLFYYERIGDPCLRAFRVKLPPHLLQGGRPMKEIIDHAERYASNLPGRWQTDLYSLTKCDLACREIPGMIERIKPVYNYICQSIRELYGCSRVVVDKNQPHILKYSAKQGHTGGET